MHLVARRLAHLFELAGEPNVKDASRVGTAIAGKVQCQITQALKL